MQASPAAQTTRAPGAARPLSHQQARLAPPSIGAVQEQAAGVGETRDLCVLLHAGKRAAATARHARHFARVRKHLTRLRMRTVVLYNEEADVPARGMQLRRDLVHVLAAAAAAAAFWWERQRRRTARDKRHAATLLRLPPSRRTPGWPTSGPTSMTGSEVKSRAAVGSSCRSCCDCVCRRASCSRRRAQRCIVAAAGVTGL